MSRLAEGQKAPAFTLKDQNGDTVSLKDFAGERVVLYFYPADDTPGCTNEACQFNDELSSFRDLHVKVIGISPDGANKHQAFRSKYGLNFTLLSDPDKSVMERYGAFGEKMMYGKKVQGVIRSTFVIGPKGTIERTYYNVRADGHAAKVLAGLTS
ncbi:MAG: thioredoxin-dependent thiol peroxidase [Acidimicrobiales bacterium]|jgi:peroxiredoxin Q/BCP